MGIFFWKGKQDADKKKDTDPDKKKEPDAGDKKKTEEEEEEEKKRNLGALNPIQWEADVTRFIEDLRVATDQFTRALDKEQFERYARAFHKLPPGKQMAVSNALYRRGQNDLYKAISARNFEALLQPGAAR
jgi:hypothetical protein